MKNHIIIKFIAVFLCAASLMGAVGGAFGLFAVTELGLRYKTLEEARAESQYGTADALAGELAMRYAAKELGGADDSLLEQYYSNYWLQNNFDWDQVGFVIRDQEGNALYTHASEFAVSPAFYEISTGGFQHIKVLNKMTQDEYNAIYNPVTDSSVTEPVAEQRGVVTVPPEGCEIGIIQVEYSDGSEGGYGNDSEALGRLSWYTSNQLIFEFHNYNDSSVAQALINDLMEESGATRILLSEQDGSVVCDIYDQGTIWEEVSTNHGNAYLLLRPLQEGEYIDTGSIYDAIPAEGQYVNVCYVKYADGYEESVGGSPDIGFLSCDEDGFVVFTANDPDLMDLRSQQLVHICFSDEMGNQIYEAADPQGVGQFVLENDTLIFTSRETTGLETTPAEPETEVYVYDDVPPRGYAVYEMDLWLEGSSKMLTITGTEDRLGLVTHDDSGNVIFTAEDWKDFVFSKPAQVQYILMSGQDGRILYETYELGKEIGTGDPIGYFAYDEAGDLVFGRITDSVALASLMETAERAAAEESIPEATEVEALPETTEENLLTDESAAVDAAENTEPEETMEVTVPAMAEETSAPTESVYGMDAASVTAPVMASDETYPYEMSEDSYIFGYYDSAIGKDVVVEYTYEETPAYTVEIMLGYGALQNQYEWVLIELVYRYMDLLLPVLLVSLVLFAITAVYLCCAAGRKPGSTEIRAGGLNCLPIDLYLVAAMGGVALCTLGMVEGGDYLLRQDVQTGIVFIGLMAYAACLLIAGFCFAFAAQVKTPGGCFWRNSLCGRSLKLIAWLWRKFLVLCGWLWRFVDGKLEPLMVRIAKAAWKLTKFFWLQLKRGTVWLCKKILQGCDWLSRILGRFLSMLPLTWQILLIGFALVIFLYVMIRTYKVGYILIGFGVFFGVILYAASAFGILLENAKRMRKGDLDSKVDDKLLIGSFREFAGELNGLADVAVVAAQKQLKSERMKTELITNVSHDIKTPLTSIINYVDLMEKPHSPEERAAYLEVLSRQSQRLKKLIDDLMEMSKASTGNMAVDITRVNAGEAVNQALGEFADKLDKCQLIPVFRQPEKEIHMMADGRLVWRVLSNLLSNAVKYAMPGTRLYIDLMEMEDKVVLSLKNISRESLNVSADELLERFVRGDTARNTEGSGLGLNIAQSLMELQKGKLELLVDGDLFKVTLIFPGL